MSSGSDGFDGDELDQELRRLFADDRLSVLPREGAEDAILAGARRVRKRRAVLATAGGVTSVLMLVAGVVTVNGLRGDGDSPHLAIDAASNSAAPPSTAAPAPTVPGTSLPPSMGETETHPSTNPTGGSTGKPSSTTVPTSPKAGSVPMLAGAQIGPSGYGNLKLAMTADQAAANGITLTLSDNSGSCEVYSFSGSGVPGGGQAVISPNLGVVTISPSGVTHTPEKIGKGSTKDDVFAAYPGARQSANTGLVAPAGGIGRYTFGLDGSDKVSAISLSHVNQDCAG